MRVLNDYQCPECGAIAERFVSVNAEVRCEHCNALAVRVVAPPNFHLEPFSGDFPSATRAWELGQMRKVAKAETER